MKDNLVDVIDLVLVLVISIRVTTHNKAAHTLDLLGSPCCEP